MTDYIKREDVDTYFNNRNAWYNFYETLESIPSADVVEVRHGSWKIIEYEYFTCSECGYDFWNGCDCTAEAKEKLTNGDYPNYCPQCGARMDRTKL